MAPPCRMAARAATPGQAVGVRGCGAGAAGGRQRVVVSLVVITLGAIVAGVLTDRFVLSAEWWQTDQRVSAGPAPRLLDIGPPPGPLAAGWHVDTRFWHSGIAAQDQIAHLL